LGQDDFAVREFLEEHLDQKIVCECEILTDPREDRKEALRRQFGLDVDSVELL
jgi:hypothetical protein